MVERMDRLPPQVRSIIERTIAAHRSLGVITLSDVVHTVRTICPDSVSDRALEDAITEQAVGSGLAVHFDRMSAADAQPAGNQA